MKNVALGSTGIDVSPLCLGAMMFGSRDPEATSVELLDAYHEAGGTFIDTANIYAWWVAGHHGGESETLLGEWMRTRKNRSKLFIATKVGFGYEKVERGLSPSLIESECEKSLKRLGIETIDLYYAHVDDRTTPQERTLAALDRLVRGGKVRFLGASNFLAWRLAEAEALCRDHGWAPYACVQQRHTFLRPRRGASFDPQVAANDDLIDYCTTKNISLLPYSPLLGGAYTRAERPVPEQYRGSDADRRLARLKQLSADLHATPNQVVLAWMMASGSIPVMAASTRAQLTENLGALDVAMSSDQIRWLERGEN